jgi:hypothetical protein
VPVSTDLELRLLAGYVERECVLSGAAVPSEQLPAEALAKLVACDLLIWPERDSLHGG